MREIWCYGKAYSSIAECANAFGINEELFRYYLRDKSPEWIVEHDRRYAYRRIMNDIRQEYQKIVAKGYKNIRFVDYRRNSNPNKDIAAKIINEARALTRIGAGSIKFTCAGKTEEIMKIKGKTYKSTGFWMVLVEDRVYTIPVNCHYGVGDGLTYYNWGCSGVEDCHSSFLEGFENAPIEEFNLEFVRR